jgi:hypothetical protein
MASGVPISDLLERIQGEYLELPGLRLTGWQARRLWDIDRTACDALLSALVDVDFLQRAPDGSYMQRRPSKTQH